MHLMADTDTAPYLGFETKPLSRGAIACGNPDAARAGIEVYEAGGNAIDACVAAAFAMGVVEPLDSGLGAGGFMTLHHAASGTTTCLDFMGTAPAAARYEIFPAVDPTGDYAIKVKDRANEDAHPSVAVPGAAAGLCQAIERFGSLDRRTVMAPAIRLGRNGFTVASKSALRMQRSERLLNLTEECRRVLKKPDGSLFQAGDRMAMTDYAASLEMVAEHGASVMHTGPLAQAIVADMRANAGFITADDLASYTVIQRTPPTGSYRGRTLSVMAPPSSGFLVTAALGALERAGVPDREEARAEALVQVMLAMFERRRTGLGDPAFVPVNTGAVTTGGVNTGGVNTGAVNTGGESTETTSLSAIDAEGNGCTITFSNNNHSGVVVPGTGILLNNQMRLFHPWPGSPNSIAGGKRPTSSMMPSLIVEDGRAVLSIGASGSTRILSAILQILFHHIGRGLPLNEAVREPRLHAEEDTLMSDADLKPIAAPLARRLGLTYSAQPGRDPMMASCQSISVNPDGTATAVGDPRARAQGLVV
jgi:gamma-glutamyltranspeptidase/glutathione hydrolase